MFGGVPDAQQLWIEMFEIHLMDLKLEPHGAGAWL